MMYDLGIWYLMFFNKAAFEILKFLPCEILIRLRKEMQGQGVVSVSRGIVGLVLWVGVGGGRGKGVIFWSRTCYILTLKFPLLCPLSHTLKILVMQ